MERTSKKTRDSKKDKKSKRVADSDSDSFEMSDLDEE